MVEVVVHPYIAALAYVKTYPAMLTMSLLTAYICQQRPFLPREVIQIARERYSRIRSKEKALILEWD
jgi:hypothetical protein